MPKGKNPSEDREKLEETVKVAEDLIALLKQFKVPTNKKIIRKVNEARKHLNETEPSRQDGGPDNI